MTAKAKHVRQIVKTKPIRQKCGACYGLGFVEKEAGLIVIKCEQCNGTGIVIKRVKADGNEILA